MKLKSVVRLGRGAAFVLINQAAAQTLEVTSTGVGIGTTAPSTPLQVVGPITAGSGGGSTQGVDYLYGYYGTGKIFTLGSQYSSAASFLGYSVKSRSGAVGYLSSTSINVGRSALEANNGFVAFLTGTTQTSTDGGSVTIAERMRIDAAGNVGIGTTTPRTALHVNGVIGLMDAGTATHPGGVMSEVGARLVNFGINEGSGNRFGTYVQSDQGGMLTIDTRLGSSLFTFAGRTAASSINGYENPLMSILPSGNVGIGTTTPGYKLEVAGSVRATSFIANSNTYADFVFKPGYQLRSLSEVEAAIKAHGHLPDIPSEAEAKARGIDLAAMQVKLLQKVEELTLYLVAHEKTLQTQQQELQRLHTRNETLERQVAEFEKR